MSIYSYLEKVALESMPRHRFAESAVPYSARKKEYKKFIKKRSKARKPSNTEYVPGYAIGGGIVGGLVGAAVGQGDLGVGAGAAIGGLMGVGAGAIGGLMAATNEQVAIDNAKKIVKGGKYDKALQDEIQAYKRYKELERRSDAEFDRFENRLQHSQTMNRLDRIERKQKPSRSTHTTVILRRY